MKQPAKCQTCNDSSAEWAWQPFGPGEEANVFTTPGSYYRGFPVVKICDNCKRHIERGIPLQFTHRGARYIGDTFDVHKVPDYVGDILLWWETSRA